MTQTSSTRHESPLIAFRFRPPIQVVVFITTAFLVILSIGLFMIGSTCDQVGTLLTDQNAASLKLWTNLDYFKHHHAPEDSSLPPGLMDDLVQFSRNNANIIKVSHRLRLSHIVSQTTSWDTEKEYIRPIDGNPIEFGTLGVNPRVKNDDVVEAGMYQLELFQAIREYAQDSAAIDKTYITAISMYILPCLYALLGAFLYTCRSSELKRKNDSSKNHGSRYAMAFILGATISVFSSLLPKELVLPPLALAFLAGYSIDAFTSQLDVLVEKMKHPGHREMSEGVAGA
jgi:hypothetical protein